MAVPAMEICPDYLNTIFVTKSPEKGWPKRFFIITACNPRSSGDRSSDHKAHVSLRKTLSRLGCWNHPVYRTAKMDSGTLVDPDITKAIAPFGAAIPDILVQSQNGISAHHHPQRRY
jgi:hypothetical protein